MMKNNKKREEYVINISLSPVLATALAAMVLAVILWYGVGYRIEEAAAYSNSGLPRISSEQFSRRNFYLTQEDYSTLLVNSACEPGYHFASLWELLDTSNLTYNQTLGAVWLAGDLGYGPPSEAPGWIRTGYESKSDSGIPGRDNCSNWTLDDINLNGTSARLRSNWASTSGNFLQGWEVMAVKCDQSLAVWCVED